MKKIFIIAFGFITSVVANAQILTNTVPADNILNSNVIFDASTNYSVEAGESNNRHKGIVIPSVDLINFEFDVTWADGITFPTYFDGMIVYNRSTGTTLTAGNRSSTATAITPGYYYFYNPNGATSGEVKTGVWRPFTTAPANPVVNIGTSETTTNTQVAGSQVYAIKGQFTTTGTTTAITLPTLGSAGSLYSITIFKKSATGNGAKVVYAKDLYSYDPATGAAVTGSPSISVVYPADTYDYVMEYMKN